MANATEIVSKLTGPEVSLAPGSIQSQTFFKTHELRGAINDGFIDTGPIDADWDEKGTVIKNVGQELLTFDAQKDSELQKLIQQTQEAIEGITDPVQKAAKVSDIVYSRLHKSNALEIVQNDYESRPEGAATGQQKLIGELTAGVCRQKALLFQYLGAKVGLDVATQRGYVQKGEHAKATGHYWNKVYDNGKTYYVDLTQPKDKQILLEEQVAEDLSYLDFKGERLNKESKGAVMDTATVRDTESYRRFLDDEKTRLEQEGYMTEEISQTLSEIRDQHPEYNDETLAFITKKAEELSGSGKNPIQILSFIAALLRSFIIPFNKIIWGNTIGRLSKIYKFKPQEASVESNDEKLASLKVLDHLAKVGVDANKEELLEDVKNIIAAEQDPFVRKQALSLQKTILQHT